MDRSSKKLDILEKASYLLTTVKSIFSKVAGRGLQSVASFSTKITFFTVLVLTKEMSRKWHLRQNLLKSTLKV